MKRPQTTFHADTMSDSRVMRSKKGKLFREVKVFLQQSFSLYRYFTKATTTHIEVLWQVCCNVLPITGRLNIK